MCRFLRQREEEGIRRKSCIKIHQLPPNVSQAASVEVEEEGNVEVRRGEWTFSQSVTNSQFSGRSKVGAGRNAVKENKNRYGDYYDGCVLPSPTAML